MKIMPTNYYSSNRLVKNDKQNNCNISSKGVTSFLIGMAIKEGSGAIKSRKKIEYLRVLKEHVWSDDLNKFTMGVKAITKTPNAFYNGEGWVYWLAHDLDYISALREHCLYPLNRIPDNNYYNVQTKKDFITSWFDNGHSITRLFVEKFSALPESLYKSFKEEIVDTAFFSTKYNQKRVQNYWYTRGFRYDQSSLPSEYEWACEPFSLDHIKLNNCYNNEGHKKEICSLATAFDNLKLTSTLDKSIHSSFINQRRGIIEQSKQLLENYFNRVKANNVSLPPNTYSEYINELKTI